MQKNSRNCYFCKKPTERRWQTLCRKCYIPHKKAEDKRVAKYREKRIEDELTRREADRKEREQEEVL